MTPERVKALEDINFCWDLQKGLWDCRYEELCEYARSNNGQTSPQKYTHYELWKWVSFVFVCLLLLLLLLLFLWVAFSGMVSFDSLISDITCLTSIIFIYFITQRQVGTQRYQMTLWKRGKPTYLSPERIHKLNATGKYLNSSHIEVF